MLRLILSAAFVGLSFSPAPVKEEVEECSSPYIEREIVFVESKVIDTVYVLVDKQPGVKITGVSPKIAQAIHDFKGPKMILTSGLRPKNKKSKHCKGHAVDIKIDDNIVRYLNTDQGKAWLKKHKLHYYVEALPGSGFLSRYSYVDKSNLFYNPNCTGPHIHLELR